MKEILLRFPHGRYVYRGLTIEKVQEGGYIILSEEDKPWMASSTLRDMTRQIDKRERKKRK